MYALLSTLALVAAAAAEAPYFSSRPSGGAPSFSYSPGAQTVSLSQPASAPLPLSRPSAQYVQYPPAPQPQQYSGYNYERPSIAPALVQQPALAPAPAPAPQPVQLFQQSQQQQGYSYPAPQPYSAQQLSAAPALPAAAPQVSFQPQLAQHVQYSQPQIQLAQPQAQQYSQQQVQFSQAQAQVSQPQALVQSAVSQPALSALSFSSGNLLDSQLVGRVQDLIAQNEDNYARSSGYYRVSGVALESVNPSIELSSFVQNVPLGSVQSIPAARAQAAAPVAISQHESTAVVSSGHSSVPSNSYGLPAVIDARSLVKSLPEPVQSFLPQPQPQISQPISSYGAPY